MKLYSYTDTDSFTNTYLVVNEKEKKSLLIDPSKITTEIINQIENNKLELSGVLITHNHHSHVSGLATLKKIYDTKVYAADPEISGSENLLQGDSSFELAGLKIDYYSVPGHTADSLIYKINNILFTGDVLYTGRIGSSSCTYTKMRLCSGIKSKIFAMPDTTTIMPGHGPLTSIGAEKLFNTEVQ